jgi:peptidoglycan/LPS O-acetylase OafA/YrhL
VFGRQRGAIPGLDFVRFSAAALVMLYHLGASSWAAPESISAQIVDGRARFPELFRIAWAGFVGVEIFFVISGFVIMYSAAESNAVSFARSRVARLYPAAWICAPLSVISVLIFHLEGRETLLREYLGSIVLLPLGPWADSVYWTLGIEMVFYSVIFCMLAVHAINRYMVICYVLGGVSAAYWILGDIFAPSYLSAHLWGRWHDLSLAAYGIYFALGMLLYSFTRSGYSWIRLAFGTALVLAAAIEIYNKAVCNNHIFHSTEPEAVPIAMFFVAVTAMAALFRWKASETTARTLRVIGLMTYPLYLIHDNFGSVVLRFGLDAGLNRFAALVTAMAICIATSALIATIIEPPIQFAVRRMFDRLVRRPQSPAQSAT